VTDKEKLEALEEMMELEKGSLSPDTGLGDIDEWDSMSALSLVVLIKDEFDKNITGAQIRAFTTVKDIMDEMN
jgi:acyl carrier protein